MISDLQDLHIIDDWQADLKAGSGPSMRDMPNKRHCDLGDTPTFVPA